MNTFSVLQKGNKMWAHWDRTEATEKVTWWRVAVGCTVVIDGLREISVPQRNDIFCVLAVMQDKTSWNKKKHSNASVKVILTSSLRRVTHSASCSVSGSLIPNVRYIKVDEYVAASVSQQIKDFAQSENEENILLLLCSGGLIDYALRTSFEGWHHFAVLIHCAEMVL